MDPDAQSRVFETIQKMVKVGELKVEDITRNFVNEYLKNTPGRGTYRWTEYIWKNGVRTKNTRPREQKYDQRFSDKKDKIAQDMGMIGEIWEEIEKAKSGKEVDNAKKDLASFATRFTINQKSVDQFDELIENKSTDIVTTEIVKGLEEVEDLGGIVQIREQLTDVTIKKVVRTRLKSKITRRETKIIKRKLAQERGRALIGLSKRELSMRGITKRITVKGLIRRFDLPQDEATEILKGWNL